ncbi:hypothetical protein [Bdellovibrio sp. HCB209]|uniref:hypothetical protein n=1 Tax=Bdellovibrio sp. HCB209 TaxID=3394354 RepID=UPI0039B5B128
MRFNGVHGGGILALCFPDMKSTAIFARYILGALAFLMVSQAHAYKYMCSRIFEAKYDSDPAMAPQSEAYAKFISQHVSSKKVLDSMARYQQVMGFPEINQKGESLDLVKVRFKQLSPEAKQEMMTMIHDIYNDVKVLKYSKDGPMKFFKRHLDVMVSESLNVRSWFDYMINKRNASIEKTFDMYFKRIQEVTDAPMHLEGADVLLTALRLQHKFITQEKHEGPIVIYGSFANGKAYEKTSDLDFAVTDARMEQAIRETDTLKLLEEFRFSDAQAHVIPAKSIQGLGYLNPVVIIIKDKVIEVRVYDSGPEKSHLKGKMPFDAYYF